MILDSGIVILSSWVKTCILTWDGQNSDNNILFNFYLVKTQGQHRTASILMVACNLHLLKYHLHSSKDVFMLSLFH
jgi:hypothetical protein